MKKHSLDFGYFIIVMILMIGTGACRDFNHPNNDPCRRIATIKIKCLTPELRCKDYKFTSEDNVIYQIGDSLMIKLEGARSSLASGCTNTSELFTRAAYEIMDSLYVFQLGKDEGEVFERSIKIHATETGYFETTLILFRNNGSIITSTIGGFQIIRPDQEGPRIVWDSPNDNEIFKADSILVNFVCIDTSQIRSVEINSSGPTTLNFPIININAPTDTFRFNHRINTENIAFGDYEIVVSAEDKQGNESVSRLNFEYREPTFWQPLSTPPYSFYEGMSFVIGDKGYFVGGADFGGGSHLGDGCWEYDTQNNSWTQKLNFAGGPRRVGFAFAIDGYGYVGGGHTIQPPIVYQNDFWRYNPVLDQWDQMADLPTARMRPVAFSLNGKGYMGTGYSSPYVPTNDFWEYDPAFNQWSQKGDFPAEVRSFATGLAVDGYAYLGMGIGSPPSTRFQDWWRYDPMNDSWEAKADYPAGTETLAISLAMGGHAYVGLGAYNTKAIYEYNPQTNTWTQKTDFLNRGPALGFAIADTAWLIGSDDWEDSYFYKYIPSLDP